MIPMASGLILKNVLLACWLALALTSENIRPAAAVPLPLAGYGAAWFRRWGRNAALALSTAALAALFVWPITLWACQHPLWHRPEGWNYLSLPVDLLLLDLWIYWWHRANHRLPPLWRFHEVHHRDQFLDASTALRFHMGEVAISACVRALVIMALAIPLWTLLVFETLVSAAAIFHHANWRLSPSLENRLARLIITPGLHWVHHHARQADTDSTYGTIFSFWDRLFGSSSRMRRAPLMPIGVAGEKDASLWALFALPFRRIR